MTVPPEPRQEEEDPLMLEAQEIARRAHPRDTALYVDTFLAEWAKLLERQANIDELKRRYRGRF